MTSWRQRDNCEGIMSLWLLELGTFQRLERMADRIVPPQDCVEQLGAVRRRERESLMALIGRTAQISITGVLTQAPDWLSAFFGGGNTTYGEIIEAIQAADSDPNVEDIELSIDSPGGEVAGLFGAMAAVQAASKPVRAAIHNLGASAAYGLASQAGEVVAANRAVRIGSVGVATSFWVRENVVDIASTEAPDKRPDVTTEAGKAVVRRELDALHELLAEGIANGRNTTVESVNATYGQGATVLADEALAAGMIDRIAADVPASRNKSSVSGGVEDSAMDPKTLKAQHPETYAAVVAVGVAQERDRVVAHLTLGQSCGAVDTAIAAVKDGAEMTQTLTAEYVAASVNRNAAVARVADDAAAAAATGGTSSTNPEAPDLDDQAVELLDQQRTVTRNG